MSEIDLSVDLGFMKLRNPVMIASGTFGYGTEYRDCIPLSSIGGFVTKGTTLEPRAGNPPPRIWETPSGILNSIGLQNPGVDAFIEKILPGLDPQGARLVVNVAGARPSDYVEVARRLDGVEEVDALEVNISCPNVACGGIAYGIDPDLARDLLVSVVASTAKPVIAKLTPNTSRFVEVAVASRESGCAAVSLTNTFLGMAIDADREMPALANVRGGLSGPAIKPLALHQVFEVAAAVDCPVIGMGGISTGIDAVEFMLAGASAVQVGTAVMSDPRAPARIIGGIESFMRQKGYVRTSEFTGKANRTTP